MVFLTWQFETTALDQNGNHPVRRMDTGDVATVTGGNLVVTTTGYVLDVSDVDFTRKWRMSWNAKCQATSIANPTYFVSIGPVYKASSIGGMVVWRPPMSQYVRLDDAPCVTDYRRQCANKTNFQASWFPPFELVYDPQSDVRQLSLYHEGVLCSTTPIGNRNLDTTYRYIYFGCLVDSGATPCSISQFSIESNWDGTPSWTPVIDTHLYYRLRLFGACTLLEAGLDTNRSATTDDGVTIRTNTLALVEGTSADPIARSYDKLYVYTYALTPGSSGWSSIEYTEPTSVEMLQLRLGAKATDTLPTWCEVQFSNDKVNWYLEDRFKINTTDFQTSGARADLIATYQRTAVSGKWAFVRNFSAGGGGGGSFSNAKSMSLNGTSQYAQKTSFGQIWGTNWEFSVSAWVKFPTNTGSTSCVWNYGSIENSTYCHFTGRISMGGGGCKPEINYAGGGYASPNTLATNTWHHIVWVWSNNRATVKLYVNGSEDANVTNSGQPTSAPSAVTAASSFFNIGSKNDYPGTMSQFFPGYIDEVSVWNKALSSAEITELRNSGTPGNLASHSATSNLVSWYRFDASDGTDSKGTNTLSFPNGSAWSTDKP